ncbi:protein of unknown function [Nitrospira japonica]|uniref:Uncharacterized protein n=1 Tax=Nitrospira japonica TaxID=1325564 RepID=A0A1W1I601_9BACT|nr:hypothetical protein [Nitrospira japonica]SLM48420.1 protein of unknown function [Nitrospira japonica]
MNILQDLRVDEVSLVSEGANKGARIIIVKRNEESDSPMAPADIFTRDELFASLCAVLKTEYPKLNLPQAVATMAKEYPDELQAWRECHRTAPFDRSEVRLRNVGTSSHSAIEEFEQRAQSLVAQGEVENLVDAVCLIAHNDPDFYEVYVQEVRGGQTPYP